jgi:hypothetical protein
MKVTTKQVNQTPGETRMHGRYSDPVERRIDDALPEHMNETCLIVPGRLS